MQIEYNKRSIKYIKSCDKPTRIRIIEAIEGIPQGDIIKLQGIDDGYRLRVGDYRILFSIENGIIYIDDVGPRGQIYRKL